MVVAVLSCPGARFEAAIGHLLAQVRSFRRQSRHPIDHVHHQVKAVEVVQHDHVERRRRRAFLLVPADVEVSVIRASIGEAVDQPRVAVVGEDDRLVLREQRVELGIRKTVRVLGLRLETHEVDDVHDADAEIGQPLAEDRGGGERLDRTRGDQVDAFDTYGPRAVQLKRALRGAAFAVGSVYALQTRDGEEVCAQLQKELRQLEDDIFKELARLRSAHLDQCDDDDE
jgi:hypothetical protein